MKIVLSDVFGPGFCLSGVAMTRLGELGCLPLDEDMLDFLEHNRHDPRLVQVVEELGGEASGHYTNLVVKELDDRYLGCYTIRGHEGLEIIEVNWPDLVRKLAKELTVDNVATWKENMADLLDLAASKHRAV